MIKLENISLNYGNTIIFEDFSLSITDENVTVLLGKSGSGKTTLLRIIAGLEIPGKGKVIIDDRSVTSNGKLIVPPAERGIGFVFQDLALWPHFTAFENVEFALNERKIRDAKTKVNQLLDFLGILSISQKFPHQLSGGEKQLVAIARALILKPKILLMDEPLANLDVKLKRKIISLLMKTKDEFDLTVVYVTHDHKEAFTIGDTICILNNGEIIEQGTIDKIKNSNNKFTKYFLEY